MYRKPTHTDRYLHAESHHHSSQKQSAINSLVHGAPSLTKNIYTELNHLKLTLQKTDTTKKDIIKTINKHANKTTVSDTQPDDKILSILPYVKGITDRIGRILNKHNIRTIFKSPKKIGQILRNPKDQRPPLSSAGIQNTFLWANIYIYIYTLKKPGEWSIY